MEFKTKGVEMKTIKERVSKKMNTAIADMRKESFKQGKWAEQKRVLGLIDEEFPCECTDLRPQEEFKCKWCKLRLKLKTRITG